jgi:murein endopeptidase/LysM repeat protein
MRQSCIVSAVLVALVWHRAPALAVPPPAATVPLSAVSGARWIQHRIIPGDRLTEIAGLYRVAVAKLLEWNKLDPQQPLLRVGRQLRVYTESEPVERQQRSYVVKNGDSWSKLAKHFGVEQERLRNQWNPDVDTLRPGAKLNVWRETEPVTGTAVGALLTSTLRTTGAEAERAPAQSTPRLPIHDVAPTAMSTGSAARGHLIDGIQLPDNPALYTVRNPAHSWGSSLTVSELQRAIRDFRERTGFDREVLVADMSREHGGRFRPHHSHTSGRDVDIRLPLRLGIRKGVVPQLASQVDWDATWALIRAFASGGQLQYVFLSRSRQQALYEAAQRAGTSASELQQFIQYPRHSRTAVVRHAHGHTEHMHLRFKCAPNESSCTEP